MTHDLLRKVLHRAKPTEAFGLAIHLFGAVSAAVLMAVFTIFLRDSECADLAISLGTTAFVCSLSGAAMSYLGEIATPEREPPSFRVQLSLSLATAGLIAGALLCSTRSKLPFNLRSWSIEL